MHGRPAPAACARGSDADGREAERPVKVVLWGNQPWAGPVPSEIAANCIMPHQQLSVYITRLKITSMGQN